MAKKIKAGITLAKVNNGRQLALELVANQALSQTVNLTYETVTPNWETMPYLVITPTLMVDGNSANAISEIEGAPVWSIDGLSTAEDLAAYGATVSFAYPYTLTVKKNLAKDFMRVQFSATHKDPATEVITPVRAELTFNRSLSSGVLLSTTMLYANGAAFTDAVDQLTVECEIKQGEVVATDFARYDIEWSRKVDGVWSVINADSSANVSGYTTNILTVPINACSSRLELKCQITDKTTSLVSIAESVLFNRENPIKSEISEERIEMPGVGVNLISSTFGKTNDTTAVQRVNISDHPYLIDNPAVFTYWDDITGFRDIYAEWYDQEDKYLGGVSPSQKSVSFTLPEGTKFCYVVVRTAEPDIAPSTIKATLTIGVPLSVWMPSLAEGGTVPSLSTLYSLTSGVDAGKLDTGIRMSNILGYSLRYRLKTANASVTLYGGYGLSRTGSAVVNGSESYEAAVMANQWYTDSLSSNGLFVGSEKIGEYVPDLKVSNILADGNDGVISANAGAILTTQKVTAFGTKKAVNIISSGGSSVTKAAKTLVSNSNTAISMTISYSVDVINNHETDDLIISSNYLQEATLAPGESKRVVLNGIERTIGGNNVMMMFRAPDAESDIDVTYANILLVEGDTVGSYENSLSTFQLYGVDGQSNATDLEIAQCDIQTIDGAVHKFIPVQAGNAKGWMDIVDNKVRYNDGADWLTAGAKVSDTNYLRVSMFQNGAVVPPFKMSKMNFEWSAVDENNTAMTFIGSPSVKSQIVGLNRTNQQRPYVVVSAQYE